MKKTPTLDDVFVKQPWKSLLNLLYEFPNENKGLRPMEIRYALEKDYKTKRSDDIEFVCNLRRTEDLFDNYLNHFVRKGLIEFDCINSGGHLDYYLKQLGSKKFNLIRKTGKGKKVRYKLENKMLREFSRYRCKQAISLSPTDSIQEFKVQDKRDVRQYLFGFSTQFMKKLSDEDKKFITDNLSDIDQRITEIEKIKNQLLWKDMKQRMHKLYQKTKSLKIKKLLQEYSLTFLFGLMEMSGSEKIHNNFIADIWGDFFQLYKLKNKISDASMFKLYLSWINFINKCSKEEFNELKEWEKNNRDLLEMAIPISLSFFRYSHGDIKFYHS